MTTPKDGKQIANMLYHAGVETLLTVGYAEIGKKVLRRPAPKVDFNMNDVVMLSIDILLAMATKDMLIKQGIIPADIMKVILFFFLFKMTNALAMMLGGAITNAFAFSGSNYLFSHMGSNTNEEKIRHDKAIEKLEKAQAEWSKERTQRLDFINEQLQKEHHAEHTFEDVDQAIKQYYYITSKQLTPLSPKPKLSDFYTPSEDQKNREIAFVVGGMALTGFIVWKLK
ncbi:unnamed protein product [Mytilus coruscus]|uniref:Uncharacterized protein n=1 Tax=Mytilus coruscus TaxID=42192 RepID=A0A6J8EDH9_MYTCO|nr:unnamed protein product [Mytilus coruscus]